MKYFSDSNSYTLTFTCISSRPPNIRFEVGNLKSQLRQNPKSPSLPLELGCPPWLWHQPSSHPRVVLWLELSDHLSSGPETDREEEEKGERSLHSACPVHCFSAPGYCWQGRGNVTLHVKHMKVCGEFGEDRGEEGNSVEVCISVPLCRGWWRFLKAFLLQSWWHLRRLPSSHPARRWLRFPGNRGAAVDFQPSAKCFGSIRAVLARYLHE